MKKKLKITAGIILIPIFTALFFMDRFILLFFPWKKMDNIREWMFDAEKATHSVYRLMFALSIYGIYKLIF